MTDSKQDKNNDSTNEKRRKVLKTASLASGVVATSSQWHKPVLNAVFLPAHAQTSDVTPPPSTPTILAGSSGGIPGVVNTNGGADVEGIASRVLDSLIPAAHAAVGTNPSGIWRGLVNDVEDYQHCVNLTLPAGESSPTTVDVSLEGPAIYYGFSSYSGSSYYFDNSANLSGTSSAIPLTENAGNFEFSTIINGIEVCGSIDSTLTSASGALLIQSSIGDVSVVDGNNDSDAGYGGAFDSASFGLSGYGAYWSSSEGDSCTPGAGYAGAQLT